MQKQTKAANVRATKAAATKAAAIAAERAAHAAANPDSEIAAKLASNAADAAERAAHAATDAKRADAPKPNAPTPETVTQSARAARAERVAAHIAAGAHKPNVRSTTSVRIPVGLDKYDFSHLASKPLAARVAGLPAGSQAFYIANAKAYAGRDVNAGQLDNAKLARVISAGLATATGGTRDGTHLCGNVTIRFLDK